ncbi:alpha/beta hydrolase [Arthrobacter frigidicola]|nr:alpha/beta hydrolase [Arthrobacter frigidicola]
MTIFRNASKALALLTAGAAAVALTGAAASASGPAESSLSAAVSAQSTKPTIVLVHGAWTDSSSFAQVTSELQRDGYTVAAAPNHLRGVAADAASVAAFVNQATTGPVVLVGHSYGGAVITNAATQTPTVKALAYIDAFAPEKGESIVDLASAVPGSALAGDPHDIFDAVQDPNLPEGNPDLYVKKSIFAEAFTASLKKEDAAVAAASQRPITGGALQEPSGEPAWKTIPSYFLVGTEDKVIPVDGQLAMAHRAHGVIEKVDAGHLSTLEAPEDVAELIEKAAVSVK